MGKATRWLKGLFSGSGGGEGKKSKLVFAKTSNKSNNEVSSDGGLGEKSESLFGSFGSGGRGGGTVGGMKEESNRAIAMAATIAVMAEAAVAAAQAVAVVVRLTTSGRVFRQLVSGRNCEDWAAVRIQAVFRGYLKKASRANCACSQHSNLNWLDNWMQKRYLDTSHTMQLRGRTSTIDDEKSAQILEIDTGKTNFNSKRRNWHHSMSSDQNSRSLMTMADSPLKNSTIAHGSIPNPSSVEMHPHSLSPLSFQYEAVESSESSQQLYSASSRPARSKCGPFTHSKSDCSRSFLSGSSGYPNYMAYTESSKAKARSQSAPKQRRPEFEKSCNMKRVQQTLGSGYSGASVCCQSSTSSHGSSVKFNVKSYHSSGRLDRMGMPFRI